MSHIRVKSKYIEEGSWGSEIEKTIFVHHNLSCDIVTVYDENGNTIFNFSDAVKNNLYDAIVRSAGVVNHGELPNGVEYMDDDDCKLCRI